MRSVQGEVSPFPADVALHPNGQPFAPARAIYNDTAHGHPVYPSAPRQPEATLASDNPYPTCFFFSYSFLSHVRIFWHHHSVVWSDDRDPGQRLIGLDDHWCLHQALAP